MTQPGYAGASSLRCTVRPGPQQGPGASPNSLPDYQATLRIERTHMPAALPSQKDGECLDRGWSPAAPAIDKDSGWRPQARSALDYKSTSQIHDMESLQEKSLQDVGEGLELPYCIA